MNVRTIAGRLKAIAAMRRAVRIRAGASGVRRSWRNQPSWRSMARRGPEAMSTPPMAPNVAMATMIATVGASPSDRSAADPKTVEKSR